MLRALALKAARRGYSTQHSTHTAALFIDSVFPVRLGAWDLRYYYGLLRQESLLDALAASLAAVHTHGFTPVALEPHPKDGGVFLRFQYTAPAPDPALLAQIEGAVRDHLRASGGVPSSAGLRRGDAWLVRGTPWPEDMRRFASPILRVAFDGPDVPEEVLYALLRPYGRILDIAPPAPAPAGALRAATVTFADTRAAVIARHALHGLAVPAAAAASSSTRLRTAFQPAVQAHALRDWATAHPRIVIPILVFLLGTLTYTVFDPIRAFMVQAKMQDWLDYRQFTLYKWLRRNALERLSLSLDIAPDGDVVDEEGAWQERREAEAALRRYLADVPTTVAFVHGPQGSGKSRMLGRILKDIDRSALVIDCAPLLHAGTDARLLAALAAQTGYWPVFTFLNSVNHLVDLASVGLIGQKAGLSASLPEQTTQLLEVVGTALRASATTRRTGAQRARARKARAAQTKKEAARVRERIARGTWFDPRMGAVAGGGVMAELGVGDERVWDADLEAAAPRRGGARDAGERGRVDALPAVVPDAGGDAGLDAEAVGALPIVVVKNFAPGGGREEVMDVFARWAAALVEGGVAHVVVVSDNREYSKRLAKALPAKPLSTIALSDADAAGALMFVKQRLREAGVEPEWTAERTARVERLGGRASDLASLIHKVRGGQRVEDAVEDIVGRGVAELRKGAFGDDAEDARALPWTRVQAWAVVKALAQASEVPYHDVLVNFPFRGDEGALRGMEQAEMIAITAHDGRAAAIRPGKPVYRHVFERLANDAVFAATQDLALDAALATRAEDTIRACEAELAALRALAPDATRGSFTWAKPWRWGRGGAASAAEAARERRAAYLLRRMRAAQGVVEGVEKREGELKKVLKRGG